MTFPSFNNGVTVTLVRKTVTGQDEFGNDVYTSTNVDVWPCSVQPAASREVLAFADQITAQITVFFPSNADITYVDAIIWNGNQYEITGVPDQWQSPFSGHISPIRIDGTLIEGAA